MGGIREDVRYSDRLGTGSIKWDGTKQVFGDASLLPVWVADMDFRTPECVAEALREAAGSTVLGYFNIPEAYFQSFMKWERERHVYRIERKWIIPATGVVGSIYQLLWFLSRPGDAAIVLTPVYYPFMDAIRGTGRKLVTSALIEDRGKYSIDLLDFEKKIVSSDAKIFIHCSPHNPVGRVWRRGELESLVDICKKHGVIIISDEIHHDITHGGSVHIPTAALGGYSDKIVTLTSASKTFNLAGLRNSFVIMEDPDLRRAFVKWGRDHGAAHSGCLDFIAVRAAYERGAPWLESALDIIRENDRLLRDTLAEFEDLHISALEGTYLAWLDLGAYVAPDEIVGFIQKKCGFAPDYGSWFLPGKPARDTHVRINLATSSSNILKVAGSLREALRGEAGG